METSSQDLNPWYSIWTKPRATIQTIVDTNPRHLVIPLAAFSGFLQILASAVSDSLGDLYDLWMIILMAVTVGPVVGIAGMYLAALLIRWTGSWIGGRASAEQIRAAIAWSTVPVLWIFPLLIIEFLVLGENLFSSADSGVEVSLRVSILMLAIFAVQLVVYFWAYFVFLFSLGQVQGFSAWRAFGNLFLSWFAIVAPVIVLGFVFALLAVLF